METALKLQSKIANNTYNKKITLRCWGVTSQNLPHILYLRAVRLIWALGCHFFSLFSDHPPLLKAAYRNTLLGYLAKLGHNSTLIVHWQLFRLMLTF
jgi:hypothetical protein